MAKRKFDLIVFDWDGTLMNSTGTIVRCIQAAAHDVGLPIPSDQTAGHVIGLGLSEAMEMVFPGVDADAVAQVVARYRYHYFAQDCELVLFDGAHTMLQELSAQGYFLAVATGKSRAGLNRAMQATNTTHFFAVTRCADETFSKPHPAMLQEITQELAQDMARTVMIGDTTHDLAMANNAGAAGIGVTYGAHDKDILQDCNPLFIADTTRALHDWLKQYA